VTDQTATTVNGVEVRLYQDVLERILRKHGELRSMAQLILETVHSPDLVLAGHGNEFLSVRHYPRTAVGSKDMVVVYREDRQLIITAFLTSNRLKLEQKRKAVWQKPNK